MRLVILIHGRVRPPRRNGRATPRSYRRRPEDFFNPFTLGMVGFPCDVSDENLQIAEGEHHFAPGGVDLIASSTSKWVSVTDKLQVVWGGAPKSTYFPRELLGEMPGPILLEDCEGHEPVVAVRLGDDQVVQGG